MIQPLHTAGPEASVVMEAKLSNQVPVIATSKVFADYLEAARTNLNHLLRLSHALRDTEFEREAQLILDVFDDTAADALAMIAAANGQIAA